MTMPADLERLFDEARIAHEEATAAASPKQKAIEWGGYVVSRDPTTDTVVFGDLLSREEMIADETEGFPKEAHAEIIAEIDRRYADHLRFGRFYSVHVPDGEYGTKHVVSIWPITQEDFEAADDLGWEAPEGLMERVTEEIEAEGFTQPVHGIFVVDPDDDLQIAHLAQLFYDQRATDDSEETKISNMAKMEAVADIHHTLKKVFATYREELLEANDGG